MKRLNIAALVLFLFEPTVLAQQNLPGSGQQGRRSLRIVKISKAPTLDGELNEQVWKDAPVADEFMQKDPNEGMPATEKTEVRALYDDQNLYFGVRCFDRQPTGILATELRRDNNFRNDDSFAIILDTFHDHRNAFLFRINPRGTRTDKLITEEGRNINRSWDEKWEVETQQDEKGWSAEIKIPLKTLRFSISQNNPDFGIDFERVIRRKNEFTNWNNYSRDFRFVQVSQAGHLTGMANMAGGLRLRVKPYINTQVITRGKEQLKTNFFADVGLEILKYLVTSGLTLDLTVNTDFAQTEVDDQIINFDRIPIFFPEKREFFLEGAGIFDFGTVLGERSPEIRLYHSRRIGLSEDGQAIPMLFGAKLAGKIGDKLSLGFLESQTGDFQDRPGDNFAVFRLKRDLLSRSSLGLFASNRQAPGGDYNRVFGIDQNLVFFDYLKLTGMLSKSFTDGVDDKQWIGALAVGWQDDLLDAGLDYSVVEENFISDLGFVTRVGVRKYSPRFIISPRPESDVIRQFDFGIRYDQFQRLEGKHLETGVYHFTNNIKFQDGSQIRISPHHRVENFEEPFLGLPGGLVVPPGRYSWWYFPFAYTLNPARKVSGTFNYRYEKDYFGKGGRRHRWEITPVVKFNINFSTEMNYSINRVQLFEGEPVVFHQMNSRFNLAFSRKWLTSTLVQYNSTNKLVGINFRLNYIYRPGDDLFIVFNTFSDRSDSPAEVDRSLTIKLTHSFDF